MNAILIGHWFCRQQFHKFMVCQWQFLHYSLFWHWSYLVCCGKNINTISKDGQYFVTFQHFFSCTSSLFCRISHTISTKTCSQILGFVEQSVSMAAKKIINSIHLEIENEIYYRHWNALLLSVHILLAYHSKFWDLVDCKVMKIND
jgi:hypothetical protein